jgi:hypothetical protein
MSRVAGNESKLLTGFIQRGLVKEERELLYGERKHKYAGELAHRSSVIVRSVAHVLAPEPIIGVQPLQYIQCVTAMAMQLAPIS